MRVGQTIVNSNFVRTLIVFSIPDDVGEGGSIIGSGIGERNLYLCEWSSFPVWEEHSEKDLL